MLKDSPVTLNLEKNMTISVKISSNGYINKLRILENPPDNEYRGMYKVPKIVANGTVHNTKGLTKKLTRLTLPK